MSDLISSISSGVVHPNVSAAVGAMHVAVTPHFIVVPYFVILAAALRASLVVAYNMSNRSIVHNSLPFVITTITEVVIYDVHTVDFLQNFDDPSASTARTFFLENVLEHKFGTRSWNRTMF
jgi:hypothetical protein